MNISESRYKANKKYDKKAYDSFTIRMKKGTKPSLSEAIAPMSLNKFICDAVMEKIERDGIELK